MIKKICFTLLAFSLPTILMANEQQEAIQACHTADEAAAQYYIANHAKFSKFNNICDMTTRSKNQWNCVLQSISNGNSPQFSYGQCFRTDINTIRIGESEQSNAAEICRQAVAIAKQKANGGYLDDKFLCGGMGMIHNALEWSCVKNLLASGSDFSYSASQCLVNTDTYKTMG